MDHSIAHIMEYSGQAIETKILTASSTHHGNKDHPDSGENKAHNKEQQLESGFYKALGEVISQYDEVLLFGPTDAKIEFFNMLRTDRHFEKIKIDTKQADKMTENQEHAFVSEYFGRF